MKHRCETTEKKSQNNECTCILCQFILQNKKKNSNTSYSYGTLVHR